ncbi:MULTISPECIES: phosphotransferase [unclassified Streptomyces]|uniref:phosphotransferase n=2 Tax=unclassified Streptomyces TaxID=2593676 RepID=UPI0003A9206E|nr:MULTISPECIES: phosphotransferase [unclassified Streptomyces]MYY07073.1 phosphotransferase [Streptomyces sp. SID4913]
MHDDQLDVTPETVAALIQEQFPRWSRLAVRRLPSTGTVNAIFRVGNDLSARLPLRPADPAEALAVLERETRASAELARVSPFPAPEPVALGRPGAGYPMPWSLQTWLPGTVALDADPSGSDAFAEDLAAFIAALRAAGTRGRLFSGEGRGGVLAHHDAWMAKCFEESEGLLGPVRRTFAGPRRLARTLAARPNHPSTSSTRAIRARAEEWGLPCSSGAENSGMHQTPRADPRRSAGQALDVVRLRRMWSRFRELPRTGGDVMSHGDLIPGNVLVAGDRLGGVLDTGGFGPADPALDLVGAWHLLRSGPREVLRGTLGCDDVEWERGRAWAFQQAMGLVWYYAESNPAMSRMGRRTLDRLLEPAE